jgi:hypothetical protein
MQMKWSWTALLVPNFLLGLTQTPELLRRSVFHEGYLGPQQQLWIKYDRQDRSRFTGVWSDLKEQKKVEGKRKGKHLLVKLGSEIYAAELRTEEGYCEPLLHFKSYSLPSQIFFLRANYCENKKLGTSNS